MVKDLFGLLSSRQNSILSGAVILMMTVATSKFLGLIRDRLLAESFSPDYVAIFLASFRLPDLIFQLLIFGAVSVAFIPLFTDYLHRRDEKYAFAFASNVLNAVLLLFLLVGVLVMILATPLTNLIVPGFSGSQKELVASLTRVIMIGQILLVLGAFLAGVLQSYQRFVLPSLAAVFYNLGIIIGIIFLSPSFGIMGPAWGVVIGALLHVTIQLPLALKLGFKFKWSLNFKDEGLKEIGKLMSLRVIGVAVEQLNETVGLILASLISTASVTYLTFAQHLQTVPIGLFGATIAQAALPILANEKARGELPSFKSTLLTTSLQILFLTLPATAILVVLRIPAVRLVFGASQFDWPSTVLTGKVVAYLAIGLTAQSLAQLLVRGFYALKDTKTPVAVSVISVVVNILLSYYFIQVLKMEVWSLGVSYAISSNLALILLVKLMSNKVGGFSYKELLQPASKMLVAALAAALALYIPVKALDQLVFDTTKTINLIFLTSIAGCFGLGVYLLLVWLLRVKQLDSFMEFLKRLGRFQKNLKSKELQDPGIV